MRINLSNSKHLLCFGHLVLANSISNNHETKDYLKLVLGKKTICNDNFTTRNILPTHRDT